MSFVRKFSKLDVWEDREMKHMNIYPHNKHYHVWVDNLSLYEAE